MLCSNKGLAGGREGRGRASAPQTRGTLSSVTGGTRGKRRAAAPTTLVRGAAAAHWRTSSGRSLIKWPICSSHRITSAAIRA